MSNRPSAMRHWLYRDFRQRIMRRVMTGIEQKTDDRVEDTIWVTVQEQCRIRELQIQLREEPQ